MRPISSVGTIASSYEHMRTLANKGSNLERIAIPSNYKYVYWMWNVSVLGGVVAISSLLFLECLFLFSLHHKSFLIW